MPPLGAKQRAQLPDSAFAYIDSTGRPLDGGRSYRLTLPAGIPAKDFWSLVVYDTQTRSERGYSGVIQLRAYSSLGAWKPAAR